ncbi:hypothetical protein [Marinobacter confluentis]|uniref:Uncharacterized protein n=1 Tax=Marinobacter confluentis TaxID=1697557 RepID=A0A4Z1BU77_9GAMM|nr:hypothetical protein [Marinobacter confluentis]TGN41655.1 hypothetical protein E5Q11_03755 [Marinobacter confluentis]
MTTLLLILSLFLALISAWLFWQVRLQKALIQEAREQSGGPDHTREPELVLTLCVQDPIAVARRESRSARMLADRLPIMVTKLVYQEVMKELKKELEVREIDVVMQLEYR